MRYLGVATLALMLMGTTLVAEVQDKWKVDVGSMFVTTFETDMQLGKQGVPVGAKINTNDQLGLESDTAVFRIGGYYRFTDKHSVDFSYFSVNSDGDRFVENEFEWDGDTLSDVQVSSYFNMDIYKVNYGYSFYHNEDIELVLTAGLHVTSLDIGLSAEGVVNGEPTQKVSSGGSITAPLPVIGFRGEYTIVPQTLFVNYKAEYFYMEFDDMKGSFLSNTLNLEYRFLENFGIGLGFNANTLIAEMDDDDKKVEAQNQLSGFTAYLTYVY